MNRRIVSTESAPKAVGPYSQAIVAGDIVFTAGQIGLDPSTGRLVEGGFAAQLARVITNLEAVLAAESLTLADVVKTTVFVTDLKDGPVLNQMYGDRFPSPYPARSTVQVSDLPAGALVEIEAVAVRSR
ncbi:MAG TPA: Rid family detoxifying hydrolase [Candidatus Binatia bacterium]|jgi:2-iminobutanoate/2-iminopropanoate deaminase|nr:Rid family detoxifying hydrolase [Candidatus Binatia bacterium]